MNCDTAEKRISLVIFEPGFRPDEETSSHILSCQSCQKYLKECRRAGEWMEALRRNDPLLEDPRQLTERILEAINTRGARAQVLKRVYTDGHPRLLILERILAAASVCLILVFGGEQFTVVEKISRLEVQVTSEARRPGLPVSSLYVSNAGLSVFEIGKSLKFQSTRLCSSNSLLKKRFDKLEIK